MRILCLVMACLAVTVAVEAHWFAQVENAPRFENFRVAVWRGRVAALNLNSHPLARKFRTVSREQIKEQGVNFAGHYSLVSVGCGTGCSISGMVDARTGRAFFPGEFTGWTSIVGDYEIPDGEEQWTYRANSKLLRAIGRPRIGGVDEERYGPSGIYYYEWSKNRLRQVKFVPVGSYLRADPPN
jgi:hypothetical protein